MKLGKGLSFGLLCIVLLWGMMVFEVLFPQLKQFGIVPREISIRSFIGIFLSPLLHADINHIVANSISLFILAIMLMASYERLAISVVFFTVIIGDSLVWIFARGGAIHIGASGLIFGLVGFLVANVFFRRDWRSLFVAIPIGFIYWTCIFGIFPSDPRISWEAHLFGLLTGIWLSFIFRKIPAN
ncbi:MAG: rhomboid family intramembrane serine protease [bacterium]